MNEKIKSIKITILFSAISLSILILYACFKDCVPDIFQTIIESVVGSVFAGSVFALFISFNEYEYRKKEIITDIKNFCNIFIKATYNFEIRFYDIEKYYFSTNNHPTIMITGRELLFIDIIFEKNNHWIYNENLSKETIENLYSAVMNFYNNPYQDNLFRTMNDDNFRTVKSFKDIDSVYEYIDCVKKHPEKINSFNETIRYQAEKLFQLIHDIQTDTQKQSNDYMLFIINNCNALRHIAQTYENGHLEHIVSKLNLMSDLSSKYKLLKCFFKKEKQIREKVDDLFKEVNNFYYQIPKIDVNLMRTKKELSDKADKIKDMHSIFYTYDKIEKAANSVGSFSGNSGTVWRKKLSFEIYLEELQKII
jgi:hypothetical protein